MPITSEVSGLGFRFFHEPLVPNTQDFVFEKLLAQSPEDPWVLLIADQQSHGRGTRARPWITSLDPTDQLILSFGRKMDDDFARNPIHGLSLVTGEAIWKSLQELGINQNRIFLKWPNDLMIVDEKNANLWRKIGGVLCEYRKNCLVIGLGINLKFKPADIDTAAALQDADPSFLSDEDIRKQLSFNIFRNFDAAFESWLQAPAAYIAELSRRLPKALMKPLVGSRVIVKKTGVEGTVSGLSPEGFLLINKDEKTAPILIKSSDEIRFFQFSPA